MATALDWSTAPARGPSESGVQPVAVAPAVSRLEALVRWLEDDAAATPVVSFVRRAVECLADADAAALRLAREAGRATSTELRSSAQAFAYATRAWQRNVIDCIDELALTDHDSLVSWSSVPEYSAMLVLAYVTPALTAVREHGLAARDEGIDLEGDVLDFEAAIARVNAALSLVREHRRERSIAPQLAAW